MDILTELRIKKRAVSYHKGGIGFHKKNGGLRQRVIQFAGMLYIIPANANDLHKLLIKGEIGAKISIKTMVLTKINYQHLFVKTFVKIGKWC